MTTCKENVYLLVFNITCVEIMHYQSSLKPINYRLIWHREKGANATMICQSSVFIVVDILTVASELAIS